MKAKFRFYFTRHGQTFWNVENRICGATDIGLTPTGYRQAEQCGTYIKEHCKDIDMILTSPLSRAYETARTISEITGIPMKIDMRLKEQNFGYYESTPRDSREFFEAKKQFLNRFGTGESMMQVSQRIYNLLDEITQQTEHTYLLVAHNGIARHVESWCHDMTDDEFSAFGIRNCEIREYACSDDGTISMTERNTQNDKN
ncbi:MAG: histidine phosphatase family protein [Bulleidia sp.]